MPSIRQLLVSELVSASCTLAVYLACSAQTLASRSFTSLRLRPYL